MTAPSAARRPARARPPALAHLLGLALALQAGAAVAADTASAPTAATPTAAAPQAALPALPAPVSAVLAQAAELPRLERTFIERHLPAPLLEHGPRGLRWWQWIALPVVAALALLLGSLLGWATRRFLAHLATRTETSWDDLLIERLARPITLFWALVVASAALPALGLDAAFDEVISRGIKAGLFLVAFWGAFRAIDVAFGALAAAPAASANPALRGTLPLLRKIAKVSALALGLVAVLNELGFHVTSLLAGLGIGGLAVALAAQKTVENLIGSVAIGVDQPFRVGDTIQVDGALGTVERVGLRSTRIRTLDRTVVTLPNGKLADMRIESYSARDRFRLSTVLALVQSTSPAQVRAIVAAVEAELLAHPARGPEAPAVRLVELGDSALKVEVMAWLQAAGYDEFARARAELYLRFLEIVREAGTTFAYPTQTLHVASLPAGAPSGDLDRQKR